MKSIGSEEMGTALIVDDDLDDTRFAENLITSVCPHLHTMSLASGEKLIAYLEGENGCADRKACLYPFLILLDLKMYGMHGFEVLQWLRKHPPHDTIPVIVLTASGEVQLAHRAYELGARSFLTKPLTTTEFKNMMTKFQTETTG